MKIVSSIRDIYDERKPVYERLKVEVDTRLNRLKDSRWHYESRIKELTSFALKAETGRCEKISEMEDFFAGTLVVQNYSLVRDVERIISSKFNVKYRKPKEVGITHKKPDQFPFDDVRLYLTIPSDPDRAGSLIYDVVFELQIKTYLQHAWSISTHDLIYKGDQVSWSSSRIAFQVKALLEHAELSISEAEKISGSESMLPVSDEFVNKKRVLQYLQETWKEESLPADMVRLTDNILELTKDMRICIDQLIDICNESPVIGSDPLANISPYTAIFLSLFNRFPDKIFDGYIKRRKKKKVFLPPEAIEYVNDAYLEKLNKIRLSPF
jgi:ppGpp synthetase/RelA/SpoT-type nucleotidyltranferase